MNEAIILELKSLYAAQSKHSNYQVLPSILKDLIHPEDLTTVSRSELERWKFINDHVVFQGKNVVDIGANSGFFSLESYSAGAASVMAIEGNREHSGFIKRVSELLDLKGVKSQNSYVDFLSKESIPTSDILILLNVLHHLGDDFGDLSLDKDKAVDLMKESLRNAYRSTSILIFQLGFNWKGNRTLGLFKYGLKTEIIQFVKESLDSENYEMLIGIASYNDDGIVYSFQDEKNLARFDSLGEFLNRPLFIIKRK
jgi:hypothetical protein